MSSFLEYLKARDFACKPAFLGNRKTWKFDGLLNMDWRQSGPTDISEETDVYQEARLVSSETAAGTHMPVLDIDFEAALVPSSTVGHYHLYLNKECTWDEYVLLLTGMYEAGMIQEGYYRMALARGKTFVRRPGVYKQPGEGGSGEGPAVLELSDEAPF